MCVGACVAALLISHSLGLNCCCPQITVGVVTTTKADLTTKKHFTKSMPMSMAMAMTLQVREEDGDGDGDADADAGQCCSESTPIPSLGQLQGMASQCFEFWHNQRGSPGKAGRLGREGREY